MFLKYKSLEFRVWGDFQLDFKKLEWEFGYIFIVGLKEQNLRIIQVNKCQSYGFVLQSENNHKEPLCQGLVIHTSINGLSS